MNLTMNEIRSITRGMVAERSDDKLFRPLRCTEAQIKAFDALEKILGERAAATTGISLDFVTDSDYFAATVAAGNRFEVHINGLMHSTYKMAEKQGEDKRICVELPAGKKRVTLLFPSHDEGGALAAVELSDGAAFSPAPHALRWLFIGDSITQGWNSGDDSLSYALRTAAFFDAECVVQGVGGAYYQESTFDVIHFDPDVVSVAYGTNDTGKYKSLAEMRTHVRAHLDRICNEYKGKTLVGISPIWRADHATRKLPFDSVCALVKEEILAHGMLLVDGATLVPHDNRFYTDGLHPSAMGFGLYTENLCRQLLPYIGH